MNNYNHNNYISDISDVEEELVGEPVSDISDISDVEEELFSDMEEEPVEKCLTVISKVMNFEELCEYSALYTETEQALKEHMPDDLCQIAMEYFIEPIAFDDECHKIITLQRLNNIAQSRQLANVLYNKLRKHLIKQAYIDRCPHGYHQYLAEVFISKIKQKGYYELCLQTQSIEHPGIKEILDQFFKKHASNKESVRKHIKEYLIEQVHPGHGHIYNWQEHGQELVRDITKPGILERWIKIFIEQYFENNRVTTRVNNAAVKDYIREYLIDQCHQDMYYDRPKKFMEKKFMWLAYRERCSNKYYYNITEEIVGKIEQKGYYELCLQSQGIEDSRVEEIIQQFFKDKELEIEVEHREGIKDYIKEYFIEQAHPGRGHVDYYQKRGQEIIRKLRQGEHIDYYIKVHLDRWNVQTAINAEGIKEYVNEYFAPSQSMNDQSILRGLDLVVWRCPH